MVMSNFSLIEKSLPGPGLRKYSRQTKQHRTNPFKRNALADYPFPKLFKMTLVSSFRASYGDETQSKQLYICCSFSLEEGNLLDLSRAY